MKGCVHYRTLLPFGGGYATHHWFLMMMRMTYKTLHNRLIAAHLLFSFNVLAMFRCTSSCLWKAANSFHLQWWWCLQGHGSFVVLCLSLFDYANVCLLASLLACPFVYSPCLIIRMPSSIPVVCVCLSLRFNLSSPKHNLLWAMFV